MGARRLGRRSAGPGVRDAVCGVLLTAPDRGPVIIRTLSHRILFCGNFSCPQTAPEGQFRFVQNRQREIRFVRTEPMLLGQLLL